MLERAPIFSVSAVRLLGTLAFAFAGACQGASEAGPRDAGGRIEADADALDAALVVDVLDAASPDTAFPDSAAMAAAAPIPPERLALCNRPADDAVRDIFCKGDRLSVSSLRELLGRLQIRTLPVDMDEVAAAQVKIDDPTKVIDEAVFLGHSTALSGQLVSPINPRAILIGEKTLVAFQRGAQKVEIATADRVSGRRNFYLISFRQDCNESAAGCLPGDLYTLQIESGWRSVVLQDDEDLKNSPNDCRQCHQRKLPKPTLLMRELQGPWQHFFLFDSDTLPYKPGEGPIGRELVRDYLDAKGTESYAGVPTARLRQTAGVTLQRAVPQAQPLVFDPSVTTQLDSRTLAGEARRSGLWDNGFARFKRGEHLALPYFEQRPTDPKKQAALTAAYVRYRKGELPREQLPDLADIFPDDPQVRAEIGLQTEPNATPAETLIQACGSCHNDVLDQSISRARFNISLKRMSRDEIDLAIARIELDAHSDTVMPPKGMRQLDPEGKKRLLTYLRANQRSADDDALLESAAQAGMSLHGYAY